AAASPDVDVLHAAAVLTDDVEKLLEGRLDRPLFEAGVEDDHHFVGTHSGLHLLWTRRPRSLRGRRALRSSSGCTRRGRRADEDTADYQRAAEPGKSWVRPPLWVGCARHELAGEQRAAGRPLRADRPDRRRR